MYFKNKKITFNFFLFLYLFLIASFSFISYFMFIDNFQELESNKNHKNINLLLSKMSTTMKHIEDITNDYSHWNETYNFIKNKNNSYIIENFKDDTNTLEAMGLDFIIYVNLNNDVVYSKYNQNKKIIKNKEFEAKIIQISNNNREFNSLFELNSNIFYLRKSKIVKSTRKSNSNGYIYAGKIMDTRLLNNPEDLSKKMTIKIGEKENSIQKVEINYLHNVRIYTKREREFLVNNIEFFDIFDNYVYTLEIKNTMDILASGKKTILLFNVVIAFLLLILFLILSSIQHGLSENNSKLELKIAERTKKLKEYLNIVNKYVTISSTDLEGNITDVSEAFCKISGYKRDELIGQPHSIIKHPDVDPLVYKELWETIIKDKKWVGEVKNKKKNGDEYWILAHIDPVYSIHGQKIGYTSIRQEITDKKRVEKLSVTDKLTQLYNRVKLDEIFTIEIAKFHRYNTSFSIILLDIDHFKEVNDLYGHNVGDEILKEIAHILKASVRVEDIVGRWGGEEFIILINNYSIEGLLSLAEKVRKNIEEYKFAIVGRQTASFGIATLQKDDTQETILARADKSLYHAKKTGRNKVCLH